MDSITPRTVFGLTYPEYDTRKMRHILEHFSKTPANPASRLNLWLGLLAVEGSMNEKEVEIMKGWVLSGGEIPLEKAKPSVSKREIGGDLDDEVRGIVLVDEGNGMDVDEDSNLDDSWSETQEVDEQEEHDAVTMNSRDGHSLLQHQAQNSQGTDTGTQTSPSLLANLLHQYGVELPIPELELDPQATQDAPAEQEDNHESTEHYNLYSEDETSTIKPPQGSAEAKITCACCLDELLRSSFPSTEKLTSDCEVKFQSCLVCLRTWLNKEIREGNVRRITCPVCPAILDYETVKQYATKADFDQYDYLLFRLAMPASFIMCSGPGCNNGQIHESDDMMMICNHCNFKTCVRHKLPWHEGQTCVEYDADESQIERMEQDERTARLLAKSSQICPQCGNGVERSEGCDHMTCRCGNEWCYICLTSYDNILRLGESAHARYCPNHPESTGRRKAQNDAHESRVADLVRGAPVDEVVNERRAQHAANRRAGMRPLAAAAAEQRMRTAEHAKRQEVGGFGREAAAGDARKRRRINLQAPWEEK